MNRVERESTVRISGVIVCKVGHKLICCTGAGTHNFQIASERVPYRLKWRVLGHIRPPSTLQNFRAERWSAMRPCQYEAMTDGLGRHAQSGHAGGYLSSA